MFWIRFRSSIILMAITVSTVAFGGDALFAAIFCVSLIGLMELYRIVKVNKQLLGILGYAAGISFQLLLYFNLEQYYLPLFLLFLMLIMFTYVLQFPKYNTEQISLIFFGLFYVSIMLSYLYKVRMLEDGALLIWLVFIGAWGSDTCAYCVGMLIGKHKFSPKLSPKKSLEGCIGGVLGAALLGFLYASIFKGQITSISNPQIAFTIIGGASSIISQIGDFAASAIKRNHNIKDYGNLIPGHGGILDRFDSIIFTAPIVFYLAELL